MITSKNLIEFIENNDTDVVFDALAALPENDRAAMAGESLKATSVFYFRCSQIQQEETTGMTYEEIRKQRQVPNSYLQNAIMKFESAKVAMLFCGDFEDIRMASINGLPTTANCIRVLSNRNPKWLKKWCSYVLKFWPWLVWEAVHTLEEKSIKKTNLDDAHYTGFALGMLTNADLKQIILDSPSLREDFYNILNSSAAIRAMAVPIEVIAEFRSKHSRIANYYAHHNFSAMPTLEAGHRSSLEPPQQWINCISDLVVMGVLERDKVTEISFQHLNVEAETPSKRKEVWLPHSVAHFLCELNNRVCTDKSKNASQYAFLSGATNSEISEYATAVLLTMAPEALPLEAIFYGIPTAFRRRDKEPATSALKLLSKISQYHPNSNRDVCLSLIEAFNHKSKAVHQEALAALAAAPALGDDIVQTKLRFSLDLLEGQNRSAGTKLLKSDNQTLAASAAAAKAATPKIDLAVPQNVNTEWVSLAGLDKLEEAIKSTSADELAQAALAPMNLATMKTPRLADASRITPIESLEDLIYLASEGTKKALPAAKEEMLLDGLARLAWPRSAGFESRVNSLYSDLDRLKGSTNEVGKISIVVAIHVWLNAEKRNTKWPIWTLGILDARVAGLAARICSKLSLPMLAAPTHKEGWIEPQALVSRLLQYQTAGRLQQQTAGLLPWSDDYDFATWLSQAENHQLVADAPEFVQALLRLAPDGRDKALEAAGKVTGDYGRALQYALGGDNLESIERPEFALAAFRSRFPRDQYPGHLPAFLSNKPDAAKPATYTFSKQAIDDIKNDRFKSITRMLPDFLCTRQGSEPAFPMAEKLAASSLAADVPDVLGEQILYMLYPTVSLHNNYRAWSFLSDYSMLWMQNRESFLARLAKDVLLNIDSVGTYWQADYSPLFELDTLLNENGSWWLALALCAKHDSLRRTALDILIAAIDENRADYSQLAEAMALLPGMTVKRWSTAIRELARISTLHALFAWKLFEGYAERKGKETPLVFLEVALELSETYGFALKADAQTSLGQFAGTGKAAKIAKTIVASSNSWRDTAILNEAVRQSFHSRVATIERWQKQTVSTTTKDISVTLS